MPRKKSSTTVPPTKRSPVVELPDILPRVPWPPSLNLRSSFDGARPMMTTIRQLLLDDVYYIPPWQRGETWGPDRQVALCETIWRGLPVTPMLLWERSRKDGSRYTVVVDGQQRLTAMGARMLRHDGTENTPTAAHLDLETGLWQDRPADGWPPITMARAVDNHQSLMTSRSMDKERQWHFLSLVGAASDRLQESFFVYSLGQAVTLEQDIQVFQAWNITGVPIQADELEALISGAALDWEPEPAA